MTSDHTPLPGPGYDVAPGKKGLLALVGVLLVLTLTACGRGEKSRFGADSLAALVPADAKLIVEVDIPTLVQGYEDVTGEKVPATPDGPLLSFGNIVGERPPQEILDLMRAIDPFKIVRKVLFAGTPPEFRSRGWRYGEDQNFMLLFEGNFEERSKIVEALVKAEWLLSSRAAVVESLEVYSFGRFFRFRPNVYLTFLSESRAMVSSARYLQKVIALRKGDGESILSSPELKSLADTFSMRDPLWGAIFSTEDFRKSNRPPPGSGPDRELAEVVLATDAAMLAISPTGKDFSLKLVGLAPTPEKAVATAKAIDGLLDEVSPYLIEGLGPAAIELMARLTPKVADDKVVISFKSSESLVEMIKRPLLQARNRGRGEAWKAQCTNNLKQIGIYAISYAAKTFQFPLAVEDAPRAHDSLNLLVRSPQGKGLESRLFVCPAGGAVPAETDEDGRFHLDEDTLNYAWAKVRRRPTGRAQPLAACTHHDGSLIVLYTDSSVREWELDDPSIRISLKMDPDTGLPAGLGR